MSPRSHCSPIYELTIQPRSLLSGERVKRAVSQIGQGWIEKRRWRAVWKGGLKTDKTLIDSVTLNLKWVHTRIPGGRFRSAGRSTSFPYPPTSISVIRLAARRWQNGGGGGSLRVTHIQTNLISLNVKWALEISQFRLSGNVSRQQLKFNIEWKERPFQ